MIEDNPQAYEGGVNWQGDWTLDCRQELRIHGSYTNDAKILVGNFGDSGNQVVKAGDATWIIDIPQGYSPGSALRIDQGLVERHRAL